MRKSVKMAEGLEEAAHLQQAAAYVRVGGSGEKPADGRESCVVLGDVAL
jgi:hypothetical protein